MVYDNMRVAVKDFVGTDKTPTEALSRMCAFTGLISAFATHVPDGKKDMWNVAWSMSGARRSV